MYYWLHHHIKVYHSFQIDKIVDNYAASEASSFFGMMQQRLSIQQQNISGFLKGISEMVKGLFQIVREIRILNDRLQYYLDTYESNSANADSSEIVLKGLWVDQVEGGTKNPSSVYGLAATVGFSILPDIFFRIRLKSEKEVEKVVGELQFNEKIKEILKRKLRQYYEWKKRTFKELETRKKFELKYLKQHYETINLYISWVKPYLRYTRRMQQLEKLEMDSRIIKSFESAFVEIEVLCKRKTGKHHYSVIIFNFQFRSRPETLIHQPHEYGQKGPIHIGRAEAKLRAYAWTEDQIKNFIKYKKEDDIALLSSIDESIKEAMNALGDELKSYLGLEGENFGDEKKINDLAQNLVANGIVSSMDEAIKKARELKSSSKPKPEMLGALDPFVGVFKGFGEIFKSFGIKGFTTGKKHETDEEELKASAKSAKKKASDVAYMAYRNYKKSHKLLTY